MKIKFALILSVFSLKSWAGLSTICHYQTWEWDASENRSVNHKQIMKPYTDLTEEEKGTISGCTICEEDQIEIKISSIPPFKICKIYKNEIQKIIQKTKEEGFPLISIIGYRVGKSLGPLDSFGRRTKFSNHSYGLAIDFNSNINGMYNSCNHFNEHCKLIHGGKYNPLISGAIHPETNIYKQLTKMGFHWGGEQVGRQKDFMHFSKQ